MLLENGQQVQTKSPLLRKVATGVAYSILAVTVAVIGGIMYFAKIF